MLGYSDAITLRRAREISGYTTDEVADRCGVTAETIRKYEDDPGLMPIIITLKLKRLYGISFDLVRIDADNQRPLIRWIIPDVHLVPSR